MDYHGAIAGWLAGKLMRAEASVIVNLLVGIAGAIIGDGSGLLGIAACGVIGSLITALIAQLYCSIISLFAGVEYVPERP